MTLRVEAAGATDVGCVRQNNEDWFEYDLEGGIFVVCDGIGGAAAGEVASKLAAETVVRTYSEPADQEYLNRVREVRTDLSPRAKRLAAAIGLANQKVFEASQQNALHSGMGSTIVAVAVEDSLYTVAHVGDSRIYLVRGGTIQQLTNDHSLVMEQVRRGLISAEDAKTVTYQNIVTRALGVEATVQPDLDDMMGMEGDILLLCSDGLTQHVEDWQILKIIISEPRLESAIEKLISAAKEGGGKDNITVLLARFEKGGLWSSLKSKLRT
jgi:protein phosphatase